MGKPEVGKGWVAGRPKAVPQEQRVAGCCTEKLRGSPSLRSLAVITSGNHKSNSLIRSLLEVKGKLFAVCQPGTPRNHCVRPIEVEPLIRNNRTSEKEGTIREGEVRDGEGGKDISFTLQTGTLLSPPGSELAPQPISPSLSRAQGGWLLWGCFLGRRMGFGTGVSRSQPPRSTGTRHHTASGSLARRQGGGMALEMPCLCCWGVLGPRGGRTLLPCQQHLQNAAWMGSSCRAGQPSPRRGVPSTKAAPLSSKSPQRGRKPPVCTGVSWDPSLAQLQGCGDPWGRGGILCGFCGAPRCPQDRLGFGGAGDGCGRSKSRDPGSAQPPLSAEGERGAHSSPGGAKCHHIPSVNPHPSLSLLHPTRA